MKVHSHRRATPLAALLSMSLVASCIAVLSFADNAAAACGVTAAADAASASRLASSCGKSVTVSDAQTSTAAVAANPDGSFTDTVYAVPVRVRTWNGAWTPVSTALKFNPDGSVSPAATPNPVTLSGGGSGPLAIQVSAGKSLAWTWPGVVLPRPTLAGNVAIYTDALPDVDLRIAVDEFGFSEVLVVKTAEALADPALARIRFVLTGSGVSAAALTGAATSVDTAVTGDFMVGAARMWDSRRPNTPMVSAPRLDADGALVSDMFGPGTGAAVSEVPSFVSGTSVVLTPPAAALADPAVVLPVFIDPTSSSPAATSWTMINAGHTAQEYWDYDRAEHAKTGNAGDNVNMYRSLFQFSTSAWKNKHVTAVTFSTDLVHSWSCSNTTTELHMSSQTLSRSTTWNSNASSWGASLATVSNQNCNDASGVHTLWSSTALTSAIAAANGASTVTIGLRAANETVSGDGSNGWKKFEETGTAGPHLSVTYNSAPSITNLTNGVLPCSTSSTSPAVVSTLNGVAPRIAATVTDADSSDTFTGTFTWTKASGTGTATYGSPARLANPGTAATTIPVADIPAGSTVYHWSVTASDATDSTTSSTCYFKVDNTTPAPPTITSVANRYPSLTSATPPPVTDGVGKPGQFTIQAAGAASYKWGTTNPPLTVATPGTTGAAVTVSFTPANVGENDIFVQAFTAAGNPSEVGAYQFNAASPTGPVGSWALNGDGTDTGSGGHALTASNVTWTADARLVGQSAAHFDGATSALATSGLVMATNTSFSVSGWARITGGAGTWRAVAGEDAAVDSGFKLEADAANKWEMVILTSEAPATQYHVTGPAVVNNAWTFLVATFDLSKSTATLYVNGASAATLTVPAGTFNATGPLSIGRTRWQSADSDWFNGDIASVQVWDRLLSPSEATALNSATVAGQWAMDDAGDTCPCTQADVLGQHDLTSTNVAGGWDPNAGVGDTVYNGTSSASVTAGPVLRTDGSFSVSAWAMVTGGAGTWRAIAGQDATVVSGFKLEAVASNSWEFCVLTTESPATQYHVTGPAVVNNTWTFLTATFDAGTGIATLYVNGVSVATKSVAQASFNAGGPFTVGRTRWASADSDWFNGAVDRVQAFNGALTATQVNNLYLTGNAFQ